MVQGQGHGGQGQGCRSRSKVVGQVQEGQDQCHKDQGHRVKVKVVCKVLHPVDSWEVRHAGVFIFGI